ncbi:MAG: response regulator [Flavobacteriales bacterium]|jgi:DNA-binding NarL/FixJ family response regulator
MIRVLIVDDLPKLAETLRDKIELSSDFRVEALANSGEDAVQRMRDLSSTVDIVFMDIHMPGIGGIEATRIIAAEHPHVKVVMCTVYDDEDHLLQALMAGAVGYLLKDESPQKVHRSIYEAIEDGIPMSAALARMSLQFMRRKAQTAQPVQDFDLTQRETDVLDQLATGLTYEQIADKLFISHGTVRKHVENIYRKLGASNRMEAVKKSGKAV